MKKALCLWLALATPLAAWGPFAHQLVDHEAARLAATRPGLELLARPECRDAFVAAAAMPDLTFSFTKGGKTDEALDDLLHQPKFQEHLVAEARRSGHAPELAFALGWGGHIVADEVGNGQDAVSRRNVFELAGDLGYLQTGMVKLLADGVLAAAPERARIGAPVLNRSLLARALASYTGPNAQPGQSFQAWSARLAAFEAAFAESYDLWMQVAYLVARNDTLRRELSGRPLGTDPRWGVADVQKAIDAVVGSLDATGSTTASAAPSSGIIPLLGVSNLPMGGAPATTVDRVERALDLAGAVIPVLGPFPRPSGPIAWLKQKAVQATATVSLWALEHAPSGLVDKKKRAFAAFCLALAKQPRFNELKDHVRHEASR